MSEPVDLNAERDKREQPHPDFVKRDGFGRPLYCFTCDYDLDGVQFGLRLWAYSFDDAQARVDAIRKSLTLAGQVFEELPA